MAKSIASNVTSQIGEISAVVDSYVGPVLKNNYFKGALFLFFGLYAGFLAPALPNSVLHFFDTVVGKLLFIFLIAFIATRQIDGSIGVALIVAVMFLLTLTVLNNVKMNESFRNLGMEHFELMNQMRDVVNEQFTDETAKTGTAGATTGTAGATTGTAGATTGTAGATTGTAGTAGTMPAAGATGGTAAVTMPAPGSAAAAAARKKCFECISNLSTDDQMVLKKEFCKIEPATSEHFESHYANFDL